jgi:hypothetical protein
VASVDVYGFNASLDGASDDGTLRYAINFTGASARRSDPDEPTRPLALVPRVFGNARVSYDLPGALPTLALAARYLASRPADRAYAFVPVAYAPAQLELRATVSGNIPVVKGLSYRVSADWASASRAPYVVGPIQDRAGGALGNTPQGAPFELAPVDVFRATVGVQYDFW